MSEQEKDMLIEAINRLEERCLSFPSHDEAEKRQAVEEVIRAAKALPLHSDYE